MSLPRNLQERGQLVEEALSAMQQCSVTCIFSVPYDERTDCMTSPQQSVLDGFFVHPAKLCDLPV